MFLTLPRQTDLGLTGIFRQSFELIPQMNPRIAKLQQKNLKFSRIAG